MLVPLAAATVERCGAKAATLATLLRGRFPVPGGIVVPFDFAGDLVPPVADWLESIGGPPVAVRLSLIHI